MPERLDSEQIRHIPAFRVLLFLNSSDEFSAPTTHEFQCSMGASQPVREPEREPNGEKYFFDLTLENVLARGKRSLSSTAIASIAVPTSALQETRSCHRQRLRRGKFPHFRNLIASFANQRGTRTHRLTGVVRTLRTPSDKKVRAGPSRAWILLTGMVRCWHRSTDRGVVIIAGQHGSSKASDCGSARHFGALPRWRGSTRHVQESR